MERKKKFYGKPYRILRRYSIQIGNFETKEEALEFMRKMSESGFTGYLVEKKYKIQEV